MFKFYRNGKEITPPKRIKWHFAGKPDSIFESAPDKLEINANFWRKKLEISQDAEIVYLKSDEWTMDLPKITPIQEDECTTTATTLAPVSSDSDGDDSLDSEFSVSESAEATVYTVKSKSRKKAAKLSDVPTDLRNDDGATC